MCPLSHWNKLDQLTGCELTRRYVPKDDEDFWKNDRPSWCPLISVPPHGRLIDADEIPYNKIMLEDDEFYYGVTKPYIDRMPTIIPAEKGEESCT